MNEDEFMRQNVETVGLPVRLTNVLRRHHILTVRDIIEHHRDEYACMPGIGQTSLKELDKFVEGFQDFNFTSKILYT